MENPDYHNYDPKDDPFLAGAFREYCKRCLFRNGMLSCEAKTTDRVHCAFAFSDGGRCRPISNQPDYAEQLSTVCALLSSIDSKTDDQEIDIDESMLSSETFQKIDKLGKLVSPGFDTGNITASEWIKLMVVARKLKLSV